VQWNCLLVLQPAAEEAEAFPESNFEEDAVVVSPPVMEENETNTNGLSDGMDNLSVGGIMGQQEGRD
jgi:hypothetical protein